ncbi:hypothetical protein CN918_30245 [Priestia megaterium]|nr:hypothetical protein CN918_30245 [Priestia megaterium]
MKPEVFYTTIDNILIRSYISEERFTQKFDYFDSLNALSLFDKAPFKLVSKTYLTVRTYIESKNEAGQKYDLLVLSYKNQPFLMYQRTTGNKVTNERIIKQEVYLTLAHDLLQDYYDYLEQIAKKTISLNSNYVHLYTDVLHPEELKNDLQTSSNTNSQHINIIRPKIDFDGIVMSSINVCSSKRYSMHETIEYIACSVNKYNTSVEDLTSENNLIQFVVDKCEYRLLFNDDHISCIQRRELNKTAK